MRDAGPRSCTIRGPATLVGLQVPRPEDPAERLRCLRRGTWRSIGISRARVFLNGPTRAIPGAAPQPAAHRATVCAGDAGSLRIGRRPTAVVQHRARRLSATPRSHQSQGRTLGSRPAHPRSTPHLCGPIAGAVPPRSCCSRSAYRRAQHLPRSCARNQHLWYLQATPALMSQIAEAGEALITGGAA